MLTLTSLSDIQSCSIIKGWFVAASFHSGCTSLATRISHENFMTTQYFVERRPASSLAIPNGSHFADYNFNLVDVSSSAVLTSAERLFRTKLVHERLPRRGILIQATTGWGAGDEAGESLYDFSRELLAKCARMLCNLMDGTLSLCFFFFSNQK